jgi:hypothetical protein
VQDVPNEVAAQSNGQIVVGGVRSMRVLRERPALPTYPEHSRPQTPGLSTPTRAAVNRRVPFLSFTATSRYGFEFAVMQLRNPAVDRCITHSGRWPHIPEPAGFRVAESPLIAS